MSEQNTNEGLTFETSALETLNVGQFTSNLLLIYNSVDENKFILYHPLQRITTVSLETNPPNKCKGVKNSWETIYSADLLMTLREVWLALPQI